MAGEIFLLYLERCHFLWLALSVKFWEIARAQKVVCFDRKCVAKMGRTGECEITSVHGRIMVGSGLNRLSIGGSN